MSSTEHTSFTHLGQQENRPHLEGDLWPPWQQVSSHPRRLRSFWALLPTYLVHTDVAFVTEHHLIAVLTVR